MTTAIVVVVLALLAVGIVIDELLRLRKWLKQPPPNPKDHEPPSNPMPPKQI